MSLIGAYENFKKYILNPDEYFPNPDEDGEKQAKIEAQMRKDFRPPEDLLNKESEIAEIRELYKGAIFHGTGRFSHKYANQDKECPEEGINDILKSILTDGLLPQRDLITRIFFPQYAGTISLAPQRIYARCYGQLFETEDTENLKYSFGSQEFWWNQYMDRIKYTILKLDRFAWGKILLKNLITEKDVREVIKKKRKENSAQITESWLTNVRRRNKDHIKPKDVEIKNIKSDIGDNYPVLLGFYENKIKKIKLPRGISDYEIRTDKIIHPDFLEVPENKMEDTRKAINKLNIEIPIIPMELGEVICWEDGYKKCLAPVVVR